MTDRVLFTLALLVLAVVGAGCMTAMEIAQVPIDRGNATVMIGFLGTIAAVFIGLLKAEKSSAEMAKKVGQVEQKVEMHHRDVEAKLDVVAKGNGHGKG